MRNSATIIPQSRLLDYVTKREFGDFVEEVRGFRSEMIEFRDSTDKRFAVIDERFSEVDRRFNNVDRKFNEISKTLDQVREDIRINMGVLHEQFRDDLRVGLEYIQNVDAKKVDKKDFEELKSEVQRRFFAK